MGVLKVGLVFAVMLFLIKRKMNIGLAMSLAGLGFAFIYFMQPIEVAQTALKTLTSYSTIRVVVALILVNWLERFMRHTGKITKMINSLKEISGDPRVSMATLPAILGLLPSPGGAKFSAPLVEEATVGLDISGNDKSYINYWYRHLWEYTFPLYPALILAAELLEVPVGQIAMYNIPFTVLAIILGIFFALKHIKVVKVEKSQGKESWLNFTKGIFPIIVIMILVIGFKVDVNLSIGIVLAWLIVESKLAIDQIWEQLRAGMSLNLVLLVFGTLFFKEMLVDSGGMDQLITDIKMSGIPNLAVMFFLPFAVGFLTGLNLPMVSITFPIVAILAKTGGGIDWALITYSYVCGFAGVMLSPVHLCFILSVDHFKSDFAKVYWRLWLPQSLMIIAAFGYYWLLRVAI